MDGGCTLEASASGGVEDHRRLGRGIVPIHGEVAHGDICGRVNTDELKLDKRRVAVIVVKWCG